MAKDRTKRRLAQVTIILPGPKKTKRRGAVNLATGIVHWRYSTGGKVSGISGSWHPFTCEFTPLKRSATNWINDVYVHELPERIIGSPEKSKLRHRAKMRKLKRKLQSLSDGMRVLCPDGKYRAAVWANLKQTRAYVQCRVDGKQRHVTGSVRREMTKMANGYECYPTILVFTPYPKWSHAFERHMLARKNVLTRQPDSYRMAA